MVPALPLLPSRPPAAATSPPVAGQRATPQQRVAEAQQILVLRPARLEDGQQAIQAVRSGRSVVLNASALDPELGQRLVDFTFGGITAMDGQSHRLGEAVFLFAPLRARIEADEPSL